MQWSVNQPLDRMLQQAQAEVRQAPADPKPRIFLFQLLCVLGHWERAITQLQVIGELDAASLPMVHTYRAAIAAEEARRAVFEGRIQPLILGRPERWIALALESLRLESNAQHEQAIALRAEAFELAPASPGQLRTDRSIEFEWLADADPRLGPMMEAVIDGKYYWTPLSHVSAIAIEPPADLRDLVWIPVQFRWRNEGESFGLVPTRYPGSETHPDDRIKRATLTDWLAVEGDQIIGIGQRLLVTESDEIPLLDLRSVNFAQE